MEAEFDAGIEDCKGEKRGKLALTGPDLDVNKPCDVQQKQSILFV